MKHLISEIPLATSELHKQDVRRPSRFTAVFSLTVVTGCLFVAAFAQLIAPFGQTAVVGNVFASSDDIHFFGTDFLGRDALSIMIFGFRNTVGVSLAAAALSLIVGFFASAIAASFGRWVFNGVFILAHAISALPALVWVFFFFAISGQSALNLVFALTIPSSVRVFRLCSSGHFETSLQKAYEASIRASRLRLFKIARDVLYEEKIMLLAMFGVVFNSAILLDFAISILGLGIQQPLSSFGGIIRANATLFSFWEFWPILPAVIIVFFVTSIYLLIDQLMRQTGRQIVPSFRSYGPVWDVQK